MCGIAAIVGAPSPTENLQLMLHALKHRGPDGSGVWQNDFCALGHNRLAIIDLTNQGHQPMHYLNRYTIVHNGEIYNYIELRADLEKKGYTFQSQTDTEVIAAAFDAYQEACLDLLDGMFAFLIWDEKEQQLFFARDRMGEKPLYYTQHNNSYFFASEMKAFWAAGIPKSINHALLFNYLTIGYTDNPLQPEETFYNNIFKIPSAHFGWIKRANPTITYQCYWDIDVQNINYSINQKTASEELFNLLESSIKRRLRSDVGFGTSLSGGLDSSSIAAIATQLHPSNFKTYSAVFKGFEKDESEAIHINQSHLKTQHHQIDLLNWNIADEIQQIFYHQEEPFSNASILAQYKVMELAKANGTKVLLDGQGADELLAGYHKYYKWFWQGLFIKRQLVKSKELSFAKSLGVQEKFGIKNILAAFFPEIASVLLEKKYLVKALQQKGLHKDFIQQNSQSAYYQTPTIFSLNGALYFNTKIHGLEELLRFADRNSMAHGVEVRLPFLNHQLIEFVFTLPGTIKIHQGYTKWILRNAMHQYLPELIVWNNKKTGFEPPQQIWMEHKALQAIIHHSKNRLVEAQVLSPNVLKEKIEPEKAFTSQNFNWKCLTAGLLFG